MTPEHRSFVEKLLDSAASHTVRSVEASNEKLDKLIGVLMQIAFALGALASTRVIGHFGELPFTLLGAIFAAMSIFFGALQFVADYFFFTTMTKGSRAVTTALLSVFLHDDSTEAHIKWEKAEEDLIALPTVSTLFPLLLQAVFLFMAVILIFLELDRAV